VNGLTRVQRKVAKLVLSTASRSGFVLAGGAALVASRLSDRPTRDIDAFTSSPIDVRTEARRVADALRAEGYDVITTRESRSFVSMTVVTGGSRRSRIEVDLGRDAISWPTVTTSLGPTLSPRELGANKVLALFGRVQTRDLADVQALAARLDLESMLVDAAAKDEGFDRGVLADMVRLVTARPDAEWPVGTDIADLRRFGTWIAEQLERGEPIIYPPGG
jgi:predicted nucleotidyltransferase component of viral defense system